MMRLCFGTYASVLWHCASEGVSKHEIATALVRSVDKDCLMTPQAVSGLFGCEKGLPNGRGKNSLGDVISAARTAPPDAVVKYFASVVIPLIAPSKRVQAVYAICRIIGDDAHIRNEAIVDLVSGANKHEIMTASHLSPTEFLAGIFLFTTTVDNRGGAECIKSIDNVFIRTTPIPDPRLGMTGEIKKAPNAVSDESKAYRSYMSNAEDKYKSIKTMIYADEPKPFYGFYVPNYLGRPTGRGSFNAISNINVAKVTGISSFIIIDGHGGVGKSMMMRHLLLDGIKEYSDLRLFPIFLPLKGYKGEPLVDFIFNTTNVLCPAITRDMMESILSQDTALLLFDGLDEVPEEHHPSFEMEVEKLTDSYPKNKYVISTRLFKTFVSYSRFTVLRLMPFTLEQSVELINRLDYRTSDPEFKDGFIKDIKGKLSAKHRSFIENPLLLTLLFMTYSKFMRIPDKMYEFYQRAFITLAETHDDTKGNFKRVHRTGLTVTQFGNAFAEFCLYTYIDNKYEMAVDELNSYFDSLRTLQRFPTDARALAVDFTTNLCLLNFEGNKYHFAHRSFQEYFCAVFFSRQKDSSIKLLGNFFEYRRDSGTILSMLYDMVPERVEANIFVPYLEGLFSEWDDGEEYWLFLEKMYPRIQYAKGDDIGFNPVNAPASFMFEFIIAYLSPKWEIHCEALPTDGAIAINEYMRIQVDEDTWESVKIENIPVEHPWYRGDAEVTSGLYELNVQRLRECGLFERHAAILNDNNFVFKSEYLAAKAYYIEMKTRHAADDKHLTRQLAEAIGSGV